MVLPKLPGFSIVITLSFQSLLIQGETYLAPETSKDTGLKVPEKRTNNFRVPMETPYDPNFWPARGRRSRRDPEEALQKDDCVPEEGLLFGKTKVQCRDVRLQEEKNPRNRKLNFDPMPGIDLTDERQLAGEKQESNCYGNAIAPGIPERSRGRLGIFDTGLATPKRFEEIRYKKQKNSGQPQLILYGNGVYWEPENLFGEKKKKQDIFWVARGKKYFNLNFPQK